MRDMAELLGKVAELAGTGLSLTGSAAAIGVLRRPLVSWVRLADEGVEPFRSWLVQVTGKDASKRADYLTLLAARAERTNRRGSWAARDLARVRGAASELERELMLLRKDGRTRQARLDARKLQRELQDGGVISRAGSALAGEKSDAETD